MDFSGQKSRVIDNPTEALSVAVEEGLAWRVMLASLFSYVYDLNHFRRLEVEILFSFLFYAQKKGCLRLGNHGSPTAPSQSSAVNMGMSPLSVRQPVEGKLDGWSFRFRHMGQDGQCV